MNEQFLYKRAFGTIDYVVFGALIMVSIAIGIFFAIKDKKRNTSFNYFLGDRNMKTIPVALSFVVTFQSSIMMLGTPAEVYTYGIQYAIGAIGVSVAYLLIILIVVPLFHPLNVTSVYEYYQLRYGTKSVRYLGVILGVIYYTLYMGIVLFGTALAIQSTTGLPVWMSTVTFAAAATLYTSIGGIKAVIWTDVFQSIIMLSGILAVIMKSTISSGGPANVARIGKERFNFFNFNPDPTIRHTFWTLVIGSIPQYFYPAITQAGVQRIIATPNVNTARRMLYIAAPTYCIVWIIVLLEGVSVFAYHSLRGCDRQVTNPNQIIPFTILEMFHNFQRMSGLFIAALSAASLSTISSGLSGLAAVTCIDLLKVLKPNITDQAATNISKLFVFMYGIISTSFALLVTNAKGALGELMFVFSGAVAGPETGMFLVSVFFRRSQPKAVLFATCVGVGFSLWLMLGQTFFSDLTRTSYLPLGPTDHCSGYQNTTTATISLENTQIPISYLSSTASSLNTSKPLNSRSTSGLKTFYSISYMYIHLLGTVTTIIIAVVGSLLPLSKEQHLPVVDERCMLPFSIFIPSFFQRPFHKCRAKEQRKQNDIVEDETDEILSGEQCTNV
ncbi:sodium-coupled monocarboxylate transporter 1-like [Mercenaria mercenaria]|uniref:sodium-coupled monocarboxylate transporter 1-like n=1 Tax=Mercenaria mercenaria TaxID=6596 RepID=UPI00234F590A|nr:sodium-coupled monocarboxylate transporter 1-like [Mercenaria mercenaria]